MLAIRRGAPRPSLGEGDFGGAAKSSPRKGKGPQMTVSSPCCTQGSSTLCNRCLLVEHILAQRAGLLALARSRGASAADAEDVVQETLTRALERLHELDPARVDGWLKTVTMNLCRDAARDRHRDGRRVVYQLRQVVPEPYVDESVAERAYAESVARHLRALPQAQVAVLKLRAEATPIDEIATSLGISIKSAESLLSRGRRTMRAVATSLLGGLVGIRLRSRGHAGPLRLVGSVGVAAVSAIGSLAVVIGHPPTAAPVDKRPALSLVAHAPVRAHPHKRLLVRREAPPPMNRGVDRSNPARNLPSRHVRIGPVNVHGGGTAQRHGEQTWMQSVQACLDDGVTVSATYVGCSAAQ